MKIKRTLSLFLAGRPEASIFKRLVALGLLVIVMGIAHIQTKDSPEYKGEESKEMVQ
jgi:hypothetical protein